MNKFILFIFLASLISSCVSYQEVQLTAVEFKEVKTGDNKFRVMFDVEVDNPNAYPIKLSKPKLKVYVAGQELKEWSCPQQLKIKRQTQSNYPFYVEISGGEVARLLPRLFLNPSIKIDGTIRAGTLLFGKRIPVSIEEKVY